MDVVVHVDDAEMARVQADPEIDMDEMQRLDADELMEIYTKTEFLAVMSSALEQGGKSHYIVLRDLDLLDWFAQMFERRRESMGGPSGHYRQSGGRPRCQLHHLHIAAFA